MWLKLRSSLSSSVKSESTSMVVMRRCSPGFSGWDGPRLFAISSSRNSGRLERASRRTASKSWMLLLEILREFSLCSSARGERSRILLPDRSRLARLGRLFIPLRFSIPRSDASRLVILWSSVLETCLPSSSRALWTAASSAGSSNLPVSENRTIRIYRIINRKSPREVPIKSLFTRLMVLSFSWCRLPGGNHIWANNFYSLPVFAVGAETEHLMFYQTCYPGGVRSLRFYFQYYALGTVRF